MDVLSYTDTANRLRSLILEMTHRIGSGHPTSCLSSVDLMTVLFTDFLHIDWDHMDARTNDRIIFSKGHASALFYSLLHIQGKISKKELLTYREFGSVLEGHPTHRCAYTEAATGSLGQGLSIGVGEAMGLRLQEQLSHVFVLLGDGELAEGSVWEAAAYASHQKLSNLIAIVDVNRLEQSGETMVGHTMDTYRRRFESFGWASIIIDGHDYHQIAIALEKARTFAAGPSVILAKTIKGKGVSYWEDKPGFHNKMLPKEELEKYVNHSSQ